MSARIDEAARQGKRADLTGAWRAPTNRAMDSLTLFGLIAVSLMLVCYALEARSPWFVLAFAGACLLASAYGFMQGVAVRAG
jgi:hypothetical protein